MTFCLVTLKRQLPLEGKPLNFIIMRSQEHCITDRMMEPSSAACHTKRHMKYSKKLMTACVELISLVQSLEFDSGDLDIIDQNDP